MKIDSGAVDTVIPKSAGQAFKVRPTQMSKSGRGYRAANGSPIEAFGERSLKGVTDNWYPFNIKAQVAAVKSPLGSVMHMVKAGNRLVFDSQGSFMQNKITGQTLKIHERNGGFEMDLWIEECKKPKVKEESAVRKGQRYCELIESDEDEDEDELDMDFVRQVNP